MKEIYNGYELRTEWDDEALGYGFRIYGRDGAAWRFPKAWIHIFMKRTH